MGSLLSTLCDSGRSLQSSGCLSFRFQPHPRCPEQPFDHVRGYRLFCGRHVTMEFEDISLEGRKDLHALAAPSALCLKLLPGCYCRCGHSHLQHLQRALFSRRAPTPKLWSPLDFTLIKVEALTPWWSISPEMLQRIYQTFPHPNPNNARVIIRLTEDAGKPWAEWQWQATMSALRWLSGCALRAAARVV